MVKKMSKFLAYILFFLLAFIYFSPKIALYYMAEKELSKFDVVISNEIVKDSGFSLELEDASLYVKSIESAQAKETSLTLLGVYNTLNVKDIKLSSAVGAFLPLNIYVIDASYMLFNPLNVTVSAEGEFGEMKASFNILEKLLHVEIYPSSLMLQKYKSSLREFNKNEDGSYSYDKNF